MSHTLLWIRKAAQRAISPPPRAAANVRAQFRPRWTLPCPQSVSGSSPWLWRRCCGLPLRHPCLCGTLELNYALLLDLQAAVKPARVRFGSSLSAAHPAAVLPPCRLASAAAAAAVPDEKLWLGASMSFGCRLVLVPCARSPRPALMHQTCTHVSRAALGAAPGAALRCPPAAPHPAGLAWRSLPQPRKGARADWHHRAHLLGGRPGWSRGGAQSKGCARLAAAVHACGNPAPASCVPPYPQGLLPSRVLPFRSMLNALTALTRMVCVIRTCLHLFYGKLHDVSTGMTAGQPAALTQRARRPASDMLPCRQQPLLLLSVQQFRQHPCERRQVSEQLHCRTAAAAGTTCEWSSAGHQSGSAHPA